jgi:hypothetical protein
MKAYNARNRADFFLSKPWTPLLPIKELRESTADSTAYESLFAGESMPSFHMTCRQYARSFRPDSQDPFPEIHFTKEAAMEAIKGEKPRKGPETDFIAISFSSTIT